MILNEEDEADTVYLLAKELAYDVVTGQTDNLTAALAKTSGKDIVQFAETLGISHSGIDGKICRTRSGGKSSGSKDMYATYKESTEDKTNSTGGTSLCGDIGHTTSRTELTANHVETPEVLKDFIEKTLKDGNQNWPTSSGTGRKTNDNAKAVAGDLTKLTPEEKTIVAGLLAKTIEGGEVVEIRVLRLWSMLVMISLVKV
ncbi:hypothetical protein P029_04520 [Anaplasma phagocytophilum str. Norway variant2]|uniref:Uncharacterized protein n=1 Tax=Anaplasma phagocytophilum str. Norway variant2 TaxID=1392507 RepID=A0A161I6B9_ANAPH|nr:hypothetical protein P029_04520 [Anaplasma phagocytophilum str. Norway variant2]